MSRKLATIRDVAHRAGVSVSTVSHVLNGNDQHVGAAKRARVREAVEALRYRPNAIARSMVKRKTATIGVVLNEIGNPLFIPVVTGIETVLRPANHHIVLASSSSHSSEVQAIETLRSQQVDGFIFMSLSICNPIDHFLQLKEEGVPFVVINRCIEHEGIKSVSWADRQTAYAATKYLFELGHTHIGTVSGPIHNDPLRFSAVERHNGWTQAMQDHDLPIRPEWLAIGDYTYEGGYRAVQELLVRSEGYLPDALFVASDVMATATLKALYVAGLRVPDDMAVIAIGDPPFAAYTIPALSTFELPILEAGQLAARFLLDWLTAGQPTDLQPVVLQCTPKIRESSGIGPIWEQQST